VPSRRRPRPPPPVRRPNPSRPRRPSVVRPRSGPWKFRRCCSKATVRRSSRGVVRASATPSDRNRPRRGLGRDRAANYRPPTGRSGCCWWRATRTGSTRIGILRTASCANTTTWPWTVIWCSAFIAMSFLNRRTRRCTFIRNPGIGLCMWGWAAPVISPPWVTIAIRTGAGFRWRNPPPPLHRRIPSRTISRFSSRPFRRMSPSPSSSRSSKPPSPPMCRWRKPSCN
jgi:hypothetical protein